MARLLSFWFLIETAHRIKRCRGSTKILQWACRGEGGGGGAGAAQGEGTQGGLEKPQGLICDPQSWLRNQSSTFSFGVKGSFQWKFVRTPQVQFSFGGWHPTQKSDFRPPTKGDTPNQVRCGGTPNGPCVVLAWFLVLAVSLVPPKKAPLLIEISSGIFAKRGQCDFGAFRVNPPPPEMVPC